MNLKLLYALALGDGYVYNKRDKRLKHRPSYAGIVFSHSLKQLPYLEFKRNILLNFFGNCPSIREFRNNGYPGVTLTKGDVVFKKIHAKLYPNNVKTISRDILNMFDAECLAIWYMDDGGLGVKKRNGKIHAFDLILNTHTTTDQNQIMIDYFKEVWDVQFTQVKNKGHYRLRCGTKEAKKFIQIVKPFILPMFAYKIDPLETRPNSNSVYNVDTSAQHPQLRG